MNIGRIVMTSKELVKDAQDFLHRIYSLYSDPELRKAAIKLEKVIKDLDRLENIKSKTHLLYSQRKAIAKEYIDWCNKNNVVLTDPTNMITWFLGFKLKEWIIRGKQ